MSGVKGRSGRGTWDKSIALKQLWDLSIPVLKYALMDRNTNQAKKIEIALALVNKMIPAELKGEGIASTVLIRIGSKPGLLTPTETSDISRIGSQV